MDVHSYGPVDIQQVLDKLLERDPIACLQRFQRWVRPVFGDDWFPKQGMVVVVGIFKLVPISRHHSLQGLSDKNYFGVRLEAVHYSLPVVAVELPEMVAIMDCVVFNALSIGGLARQHHQGPLPVGAARLGHLAVQQLVLVLHEEVFHVLTCDGLGDAAFVLGTHLLH